MKVAARLNEFYKHYLISPLEYLEPILVEVRKTADRFFRDEDAAQDFTLEIWQSLETLQIRSSFAGHIHHMATWRRLDWFKKQKKQRDREQQPPIMFDEEEGEQVSNGDVLDILYYRHALKQPKPEPEADLDAILDPVVRRTAELLRNRMNLAECAEAQGISPAALRQRLHRYRKATSLASAA